jgi:hypothetical protein
MIFDDSLYGNHFSTRGTRMKRYIAMLVAAAMICITALVFSCGEKSQGGRRYHDNPHLANSPWPILHHNSAMDAASPFKGPEWKGEGSIKATVFDFMGPGWVLFDSRENPVLGTIEALTRKRVFRVLEASTLKVKSEYEIKAKQTLSGLYAFLDNEDCVWTSADTSIHRLCRDGWELKEAFSADLVELRPGTFEKGDAVFGLNPLYESPGMIDIFFVTKGIRNVHENNLYYQKTVGAKVGVLRVYPDYRTELILKTFPGENITNNTALDRSGIYVATNHRLVKLRLENGALEETWNTAYDPGDPPQAIECDDAAPDDQCSLKTMLEGVRFSDGTGTTPTLMGKGGELIGIMDGARPMKIVLLRSQDGSPVSVDRPAPFDDPGSQTENTIAAFGDRFVINNNHETGTGVAGYELTGEGADAAARRLWENDSVFTPNNVPMISGGSGVFYTYELRGDEWYMTALDLDDGSVLWRVFTGTGLGLDSKYAPICLDARRRLYLPLVGGLLVIGENR